MKIGFDNEKYLTMQSEHIRDRISKFDNKLYLEFGGKLFDDYHASRVLPGFAPDNKIQMLLQLKDQAEIVIAINAGDIEKSKLRGDLGITYETDVVRLVDVFRDFGLYVGSIALTQYTGQPSADLFTGRMGKLGLKVYRLYRIPNYPADVKTIVSDDGSASVSFRRDSARAVTSGGKAGVTSAATGDGFPMGGMAAALLVSGSALVISRRPSGLRKTIN